MPDTGEILKLTNVATVEVLTRIQNMLSADHIEEAKAYIAEQLKSDEVKVDKEIDLLFWRG